MIKFADNSFVSDPGTPIHQLYSTTVLPNGELKLEPSGVENTDEIIQSFAESTDIKVIARRILNGEVNLLNQSVGTYGDFTNMPKTYAEMLQLQIDAQRLYDSLPAKVKEQFGNDPNKFLASAGTVEFYEKIEPAMPADVKEEFAKFKVAAGLTKPAEPDVKDVKE